MSKIIIFPDNSAEQSRWEETCRKIYSYDTEAGDRFVASSIKATFGLIKPPYSDGHREGTLRRLFSWNDSDEGYFYWDDIRTTLNLWE